MVLQDYFNLIILFIIGLCFGSFLNVCIYRLPLKKSIITPPSHCPNCNNLIKWYHNIPIISYIFLKGKCAFCKTKISIIYPLIEFLSGLVFVVNYLIFNLNINFFCFTVFELLLLIVIFIDLFHMIIPDEISYSGIVIGFAFSFFRPDITWLDSLLGIILGGGVLLLIIYLYYFATKKEGMGGGDVKLLAMIGSFLGFKSLFFIIFFSSVLGCLIGIPLLFFKKKSTDVAIPFGPFLSLAAIIYIYFGHKIIYFYYHL